MPDKPLILVADDQEDILKSLQALLRTRGYRALLARRPPEVLELLAQHPVDAVLLDMNFSRDTTSGLEGLDLLAGIGQAQPQLPVVVMTAWGTVDLAVAAMQRGARDFLEKPWDNERLLSVLQTQLQLRRALSQVRALKDENRRLSGAAGIDLIAGSAAMAPVLKMVERVGPTDASVLITGEHGTGKGLLARLLHASSERAEESLVSVNIGAIHDQLFESELFGHVKGAFTDARQDRQGRFELAHGGTLFLDEIGNLAPAMQAKLLRVIETGEFEAVGASRTQVADVRLLAATNADLPGLVEKGAFREDLLFRLNAICIELPPLRRRVEDIEPLARHFLGRYADQYGRGGLDFSAAALAAMESQRWPGNVRQLDHAVQRGVLMAEGAAIEAADLGLEAGPAPVAGGPMTLEEMERGMIVDALRQSEGNIKAAAQRLGLGRSALYRRLEKYGLATE
ncbi:MAG: response regulator [Candidatus Latescibacteria bacterium]|nr:response regulator [Candidatus Latescibacterota bacterium]